MNRRKRMLCAAAACSILSAMALSGFAEDPVQTPPPAQDAAEPAATPSSEPDPIPEDSAEPSMAPTASPTDAPTAEPTRDAAPTAEPGETPRPTEPAETPGPTEDPGGQFAVYPPEGAQKAEDFWQIPCQTDEDLIVFEWTAVEGAEGYQVSIRDEQGNEVMSAWQQETAIGLTASMFKSNSYILTVQADGPDEQILAKASLQFALAQGAMEPGDRPGGIHGGFSGSFSGGAAGERNGEEAPEGEAGFHVTPGQALTDGHSSGNRDMRLYGTVDAASAEGSMTLLTLGEARLDVALDGQSKRFFAFSEGRTLTLIPEAEGERWSVSVLALEILHRSGIERLCLTLGDSRVEIPTDWTLQGAKYAVLRAEGYVSKDFALIVTREETRVAFGGLEYDADEWIGG